MTYNYTGWADINAGHSDVDERFRPIAIYDNITDTHNPDPADYNEGFDWIGPQFFLPSQCTFKTSVMIPKRTSRCLGVVKGVGDTDEIV